MYKIATDDSDGITTEWFSGEQTKEKKSSDYEAELTYIYEDGKWKLFCSNIYDDDL